MPWRRPSAMPRTRHAPELAHRTIYEVGLDLCVGGRGVGRQRPRLFYSKSFPGSVPAFVAITLERPGGRVQGFSEDDNPLRFHLTEAEANEFFALADKLDRFKRQLESPLKVAFMGTKTFRFENGAETAEVKFNYSEDADARALADWFERITESQEHFINVERAAKYDKLGVQKALLLLEASMERKRLVGAAQFLPLLDRIAKTKPICTWRGRAPPPWRRPFARSNEDPARVTAGGFGRVGAEPGSLVRRRGGSPLKGSSEAGSSPVEFLRAIEKHMAKYPDSPRKADLERAAVKSAIEARTTAHLALWRARAGARVRRPADPGARGARAAGYRRPRPRRARFEVHQTLRRAGARDGQGAAAGALRLGRWQDELTAASLAPLVLEARATFNLGRSEEALALAGKSYDTYPNCESAREIARVLERTGHPAEAIPHVADAFTIPDARNTDALRARDRVRMGDLYRQVHGSEAGLAI